MMPSALWGEEVDRVLSLVSLSQTIASSYLSEVIGWNFLTTSPDFSNLAHGSGQGSDAELLHRNITKGYSEGAKDREFKVFTAMSSWSQNLEADSDLS